jgi:hypothetical protein
MPNRMPTHELPNHVPPDATSPAEMCRYAVHVRRRCAAIRTIGVKTVPLYAPLALLMARIAVHFGVFSTNESTNEPTKTQEIDERTQESDERTRDCANEPEVRVAAPRPERMFDFSY